MFGKKYNETTGAISGEPVTTTATTAATAPWWAPYVTKIVITLGKTAILGGSALAVGEMFDEDGNPIPPPTGDGTNTGGGNNTGAAPRSNALLPILLIGGAAAAYFILKPGKK